MMQTDVECIGGLIGKTMQNPFSSTLLVAALVLINLKNFDHIYHTIQLQRCLDQGGIMGPLYDCLLPTQAGLRVLFDVPFIIPHSLYPFPFADR